MKLELKELNSGYKISKKISRLTTKQKSVALIALTLAVVFLITYFASVFGIIPIEALVAKTSSKLFGDEKAFPINISTETVVNMKNLGESLLVLTDSNAVLYNSDGKQVYESVHSFAKPAVSVNGTKAVIFDRNGTGFTLLTDKKIIMSGEAENVIISAEYGKSGNYALAVRGTKSTSTLSVFNKKSKEIFKWNCAYENITSITLSDNGKYAGAVVFGARNGETYSGINYFGFDYKEPLNSAEITGTSPYSLEFTSSDTLTLFGDNGIFKLKKNADEYEIVSEYYTPEFNSFSCNESGDYQLTLAKYGSSNVFSISIFNGKGKMKTEIPVETEITSVAMSGKYIFALAENQIMVYNRNGKKVGDIDITGKLYSIHPTDKYIFVHSLDKISRCFSYGNSSLTVS